MKNKISSLIFVCCVLITASSIAQVNHAKSDFLERTTFKISTDFLSQHNGPTARGYSPDLFYVNPFFGIEMDYSITSHFIISTAFTYNGASSGSIAYLDYFVYPGEDAIHSFKSEDRFRSISFDPKAKLSFSLNRFNFFWAAGPVVSLAFLNSDRDASIFADPDHYFNMDESRSRSFGVGAQASTGLQYFITKKIGLSFELGYKYLTHNSLSFKKGFSAGKKELDYKIDSVFQRASLVFKF